MAHIAAVGEMVVKSNSKYRLFFRFHYSRDMSAGRTFHNPAGFNLHFLRAVFSNPALETSEF